jgi:tetratricopeptide (TPR) repeat protein
MASLDIQLAQLENAQLMRQLPEEESAYSFRHALTQEAAYESLLHKTQREIHRAVAQAFEQLYAGDLEAYAALLAHHYERAGDDAKSAQYAQQAGDVQYGLGAHPEAQAHYDQALQALARLPDDEENRRLRVDLVVKVASVSFASESPEKILARLAEAESIVLRLVSGPEQPRDDRLRLARLYSWMGRINFYRNNRAAALDYADRALPIAQDADDQQLAALASSLIGRVMLFRGEFDKGQALFARTLGPLEQARNWAEWTLAEVLGSTAAAARGEYLTALTDAERGLTRAQEMQYLNGVTIGYSCLALIHLMGGDMTRLREASRMCLELSLPARNWPPAYSAYISLALAQSRQGQHEEAATSTRCFSKRLEPLRRAVDLFVHFWNERQLHRQARAHCPINLIDSVSLRV